MGLFDFFKQPDINDGVNKYRAAAGAVLLDVRTAGEYSDGHIPGSKNVPLQNIENAQNIIKDKTTPIFVYCYSGARSSQAVSILKHMGYSDVTNIGGIASYSGKVEK